MNKNIPAVETMLLMRRLADLTSGGMTLHRSVSVLRAHSQAPRLKTLLESIQEKLEEGQSLSSAFLSQNGFFSALTIGLIQAGESTGNIEFALEESAALLENEMETRQRLRSALAYPCFLLGMAILVCIFLIAFVIPRFQFLFQDLGQTLPLPTLMLLGLSSLVIHFGWVVLLVVLVGFVWMTEKRPEWKSESRSWAWKLPAVAGVVRGNFLQRWAHMMTSLLKSGFTASAAIELSAKTMSNAWGAQDLLLVSERLSEGHSLKTALESSALFPPLFCEMVGSGEESGKLEETFARLAQSYKRETELRSKLLLSLLEPAMIAGMGLIVGFVAIAMLLPIFAMSASLK